ncbi:hypothetical protein AAG906_000677 [Vitis piasezkii]
MGHLTRLSTGDTDVDDENERDEEDDRDDAIDTDEIHLPNDDENCCQTENIDLVMVQQVVECESTRFVNLEVGDRSNNPEIEFEVENTSLVASSHDLQHVKMFSIKAHQEFIVYRSNASVLVLQCKKAPQCQWRLRAMTVKDTGMFRITKYKGPHTCVNPCINQDHSQLDSSFVSKYIETLVKAKMTITVVAIQVVMEQFGYQISYQKAMKAKRKAMTQLFGDWYKSYAELPRFFLALEQSNWMHYVFQNACFWAFAPSIKGFAHCRPVLSIDGTHLYGKYKGTLLIAMGCDGNNQLFPLAFAITEGENTDSWSWFLACIRVGVTQRKGLCLISDHACHRFCMRHLASNFNTKFKDKTLKDLMCRAAMESKVKKFISHMDTIGRINAEARNWLEQIPLEKWALSYDGGRRYGIMTTNMSEVFNGVLKGARNLPIITLVQLTFYRVMITSHQREHGASRLASGEEFTPHIDAKIKAKVVKASAHETLLEANRKPRTYHVTLQTGSCTCNKTLLLGFPCSHILAACHCYYTTRAYLSTWAPLFYPIFDELEWPQYNGPIIVPSDSMKRLTSDGCKETRTPQTCGLCKQSGHNRHSCPNRETNDRRS